MSVKNIDTTRASRTEAELSAVISAIYTSSRTEQETNWLEWKSSHNLANAEGRFAVAKAILGFANRAVTQAKLACLGVAYMVVGVEPGAVAGFPPFDHAALGQKIKKYADGPRWTPHYIDFMGVTVLVIMREPSSTAVQPTLSPPDQTKSQCCPNGLRQAQSRPASHEWRRCKRLVRLPRKRARPEKSQSSLRPWYAGNPPGRCGTIVTHPSPLSRYEPPTVSSSLCTTGTGLTGRITTPFPHWPPTNHPR